jgi:hypothetical protein
MNTWSLILKESIKNKQILLLKWVFTYKINSNGFLSKFKARICVHGDLQIINKQETRATTLAARTLRTLLALIAAFDLETLQLDAVNAFLNSLLNEEVYVSYPPGYYQKNKALKLYKALYGLQRSLLLWHEDLKNILKELGLIPISEDPCLYLNNKLILMVFVNNMMLIYHLKNKVIAINFKNMLQNKYKLKEMGEANQFLGIKIIRDHPNKKL